MDKKGDINMKTLMLSILGVIMIVGTAGTVYAASTSSSSTSSTSAAVVVSGGNGGGASYLRVVE